jgi:hypothetical protein
LLLIAKASRFQQSQFCEDGLPIQIPAEKISKSSLVTGNALVAECQRSKPTRVICSWAGVGNHLRDKATAANGKAGPPPGFSLLVSMVLTDWDGAGEAQFWTPLIGKEVKQTG